MPVESTAMEDEPPNQVLPQETKDEPMEAEPPQQPQQQSPSPPQQPPPDATSKRKVSIRPLFSLISRVFTPISLICCCSGCSFLV